MATSIDQFLAEMQRRRKAQLDQISQLFAAQQPGGLSMEPVSARPSLVGGLLKQGAQGAGLSMLTKYIGNPLQSGSAGGVGPATAAAAGASGLGAAPSYLGTFSAPAIGSSIAPASMAAAGAAAPASVAAPTYAASAAPGAAAAAPSVFSSIGSALGAAGSAVGAAASSAIGYLAALFSSRQLKHSIEDYKQVGDLRWVRYRYLPELDPDQIIRIGLIAEEVAETHPEWIVKGPDGKPQGIVYGRIPEHLWP